MAGEEQLPPRERAGSDLDFENPLGQSPPAVQLLPDGPPTRGGDVALQQPFPVQLRVPDGALPGCVLQVELPPPIRESFAVVVPASAGEGALVTVEWQPPTAAARHQAEKLLSTIAAAAAHAAADGSSSQDEIMAGTSSLPLWMKRIIWRVTYFGDERGRRCRQLTGLTLSAIGTVLMIVSILQFNDAASVSSGCPPADHQAHRANLPSAAGATPKTVHTLQGLACGEGLRSPTAMRMHAWDLLWIGTVLSLVLGAPLLLGLRELLQLLAAAFCSCCVRCTASVVFSLRLDNAPQVAAMTASVEPLGDPNALGMSADGHSAPLEESAGRLSADASNRRVEYPTYRTPGILNLVDTTDSFPCGMTRRSDGVSMSVPRAAESPLLVLIARLLTVNWVVVLVPVMYRQEVQPYWPSLALSLLTVLHALFAIAACGWHQGPCGHVCVGISRNRRHRRAGQRRRRRQAIYLQNVYASLSSTDSDYSLSDDDNANDVIADWTLVHRIEERGQSEQHSRQVGYRHQCTTAAASLDMSGPKLLRCGRCGATFALPYVKRLHWPSCGQTRIDAIVPGTTAVRCPYPGCGAMTWLPPSFAQKYRVLKDKLRSQRRDLQRGMNADCRAPDRKLRIVVRRSECSGDLTMLMDSFSQLRAVTPEIMRRCAFSVRFDGEEGVDQGGLTRDWVGLIIKQLLDPQVGLFCMCGAEAGYAHTVNQHSAIANPAHLEYFSFLGMLLAKCILDGLTASGAYFTPEVWAAILGRKTRFNDLGAVDPAMLRSLQWLLSHDLDKIDSCNAEGEITSRQETSVHERCDSPDQGSVEPGNGTLTARPSAPGTASDGPGSLNPLELYFVVETSAFGAHDVHELKPGGAGVRVTDANKSDFAELKAEWLLSGCKQKQLEALHQGFSAVLPTPGQPHLLGQFDQAELELLLCGVPIIDVTDWRHHTEYKAGYDAEHPVILRFWRAVRHMDQPTRAKLLRFVTGTSALPPGGYALRSMRFCAYIVAFDLTILMKWPCLDLDVPQFWGFARCRWARKVHSDPSDVGRPSAATSRNMFQPVALATIFKQCGVENEARACNHRDRWIRIEVKRFVKVVHSHHYGQLFAF